MEDNALLYSLDEKSCRGEAPEPISKIAKLMYVYISDENKIFKLENILCDSLL